MPLPLPVVAEVIVRKPALLLAVHGQSLAVEVKSTLPGPPLAAREALVERSVKAHETPAWFTVKICPPMDSVPVRAFELGLAATE